MVFLRTQYHPFSTQTGRSRYFNLTFTSTRFFCDAHFQQTVMLLMDSEAPEMFLEPSGADYGSFFVWMAVKGGGNTGEAFRTKNFAPRTC